MKKPEQQQKKSMLKIEMNGNKWQAEDSTLLVRYDIT